jgi:protocatechuate 3,4-dioxygenase beta subunit
MDQKHDLYDLGLQADLAMLSRTARERRRLLKMGTLGIGALLAGCASASAQSRQGVGGGSAFLPLVVQSATATPTTTPVTTACVDEIPQETAGPYPADGSNASSQTLNVLTRSGIVRSDIRTSISTGNTAEGVPLTIELTVVDSSGDCAPLAGYAVYLWHCTREGSYSLYSSGVTNEDYLRGVQQTDSSGKLSFTTIFPGCYSGRWPHAHFEIYPSLASATSSSNAIHTSQLALPESACDIVYATTGYSASVQNLAQISLATDNIFSDGATLQLATVTGDAVSGFTAQLTVGVAV